MKNNYEQTSIITSNEQPAVEVKQKLTLEGIGRVRVVGKNSFNRLGCSYRHCTLFDNNFETCRNLSDSPCARFDVLKVGSASLSHAIRFRWRVDRDEYQIRTLDMTFDGIVRLLHEIITQIEDCKMLERFLLL